MFSATATAIATDTSLRRPRLGYTAPRSNSAAVTFSKQMLKSKRGLECRTLLTYIIVNNTKYYLRGKTLRCNIEIIFCDANCTRHDGSQPDSRKYISARERVSESEIDFNVGINIDWISA
jgi:hypothetical protein